MAASWSRRVRANAGLQQASHPLTEFQQLVSEYSDLHSIWLHYFGSLGNQPRRRPHRRSWRRPTPDRTFHAGDCEAWARERSRLRLRTMSPCSRFAPNHWSPQGAAAELAGVRVEFAATATFRKAFSSAVDVMKVNAPCYAGERPWLLSLAKRGPSTTLRTNFKCAAVAVPFRRCISSTMRARQRAWQAWAALSFMRLFASCAL